MLSSALLLVASAFTGLVSAQYYSQSGPLAIDPNSESPALRGQWCRAQLTNCPLICGGVATVNLCDAETLDFTCTCQNGNNPNISNYANTVPSYVCNAWVGFCVDGHPNDLDGITACRSVQCGNETVDATASSGSDSGSGSNNAPSSSTLTTTTTTATSASGAGNAATPTSSPSPSPTHGNAAFAIRAGSSYATGLTAAGLLAIFGFAL